MQVDLNLGTRLGANYINENGEKKSPIILHRAIFGSFERFFGILLGNYAGKLPLSITPIHVISLGEKFTKLTQEITQELKATNVSAVSDISNETLS